MKSNYTSAAALFDGGWRATDKAQLITEYNLTADEADDLCEALSCMGDHSDADADSKAAVIKDIRHYLAEIEALEAECHECWLTGDREAYNRCSDDIADFDRTISVLKEAYHITDADINPTDDADTVPTSSEAFTALYDALNDDQKGIVLAEMRRLYAEQIAHGADPDADQSDDR